MPLELVTFVVQNLVEDPGALAIQTERSGRGLRIEIRCAPGDAGRVIGRNGRIINAIRTLARASADGRQRVDVHLID